MSNYDFDQITDRRNTGSLKWDVAENELPMWVADMDFQTAPAVREAIEKRAAHGVFGYTDVEEDWYQAYMNWWERRHQFPSKRMADLLYRRGTGDFEYGPQVDHTGRKRADPDTGV